MNIYKVLSNLKHNGVDYLKGTFFQSEPESAFNVLVSDGVLRLMDGASTIEEAEKMDAEEMENAKQVEQEKEATAGDNTWEPKKDDEVTAPENDVVTPETKEPEVVTTPENDDAPKDDIDTTNVGPMGKYKVTGEIFPLNEDGTQKDTAIEIGTIVDVPEVVGDTWIVEGLAEKVEETASTVGPVDDSKL